MNKSGTNDNTEIDKIEIVDLPLDGELLAKNQPGKEQNSIAQHGTGWYFKLWRRQGMTLIIFTGYITLFLLIRPDLAAMLSTAFMQHVSTPTTISILPTNRVYSTLYFKQLQILKSLHCILIMALSSGKKHLQ